MNHIPPRNLYRKAVIPAISPDSGRPLPGVNMVLTKVLTNAPKNRKQDRHKEGYMREWMRKKRAAKMSGNDGGKLVSTNNIPPARTFCQVPTE